MDISTFKRIAVESIIFQLEQIAGKKLPTSGLLCGGSVSNKFLSLVDGAEYPINDIDIFITQPFTEFNKENNVEYDDFNGDYEYQFIEQETYHVVDSFRSGLLNYIFIDMKDKDIMNTNEFILKGFDFNNCQIGIDLKTRELITTPFFDEFFYSRILNCVTFLTPAHSILRWVKKSHELQKEVDMRKIHLLMTDKMRFNNKPIFFGKKYCDIYWIYESDLIPFFELQSFFNYQVEKFLSTNNGCSIPQPKLNQWRKTNIWTLKPRIII